MAATYLPVTKPTKQLGGTSPSVEVTMSPTDPILDKIIFARVELLLRHPFFGNIATNLIIREGWASLKTAATDGKHFYYNPEFLQKLTYKQVEFVLAHEIRHCVYNHFGRKEHRNHSIFNAATDYAVNGALIKEGVGEPPTHIKIYYDPMYDEKCAEEIYEIIKDSCIPLERLGELLDEHIDWEEYDNDHPTYTNDELQAIRANFKEVMLQSAQLAGNKGIPGDIARVIEKITNPKLEWRALLEQQIQSIIHDQYSFSRPNRRSSTTNAILPGLIPSTTINICTAIDVSGSISDEQAADFLGEIKGIMQQYSDFTIRVWCFDEIVYNYAVFTSQDIQDFDSYTIRGGGGTDFEINWKYMKDNDILPETFIMFTDGMPFGSWGDPLYCDTIFIIHGNHNIVPPFGTFAYY